MGRSIAGGQGRPPPDAMLPGNAPFRPPPPLPVDRQNTRGRESPSKRFSGWTPGVAVAGNRPD